MTLTSNSTVDLLKHVIEKNAYAFKQIKRIVFFCWKWNGIQGWLGKDTISALEYHTTFHQFSHDAPDWPDINWK